MAKTTVHIGYVTRDGSYQVWATNAKRLAETMLGGERWWNNEALIDEDRVKLQAVADEDLDMVPETVRTRYEIYNRVIREEAT